MKIVLLHDIRFENIKQLQKIELDFSWDPHRNFKKFLIIPY